MGNDIFAEILTGWLFSLKNDDIIGKKIGTVQSVPEWRLWNEQNHL